MTPKISYLGPACLSFKYIISGKYSGHLSVVIVSWSDKDYKKTYLFSFVQYIEISKMINFLL